MVKRGKLPECAKPKTKLQKIIDKQSIAWNDARMAERGDKPRSLYASDYGQCMRKTWFQFFPEDYPTGDFDARTLRIFHNGEDVHERLSSYLRNELCIDFSDEIDIPRDNLNVHGRCDGICTVDERAVVVEFKSINRKTVYEPKEENVGQLMWYMTMWRMLRDDLRADFGFSPDALLVEKELQGKVSESGRKIEELSKEEKWILFTQGDVQGELIYESKQTQGIFHFSFEYDPEKVEKVRLWFQQVDWHVANKKKPVVRYDKGKFPCSWGAGNARGKCAYYEECWGKEDEEKE